MNIIVTVSTLIRHTRQLMHTISNITLTRGDIIYCAQCVCGSTVTRCSKQAYRSVRRQTKSDIILFALIYETQSLVVTRCLYILSRLIPSIVIFMISQPGVLKAILHQHPYSTGLKSVIVFTVARSDKIWLYS